MIAFIRCNTSLSSCSIVHLQCLTSTNVWTTNSDVHRIPSLLSHITLQQTRCHPDMDSSSSGAKTESRDEQQELRYVTHTTGGSQTIPPVEIRRQTVAHQHGLQYKHDVY